LSYTSSSFCSGYYFFFSCFRFICRNSIGQTEAFTIGPSWRLRYLWELVLEPGPEQELELVALVILEMRSFELFAQAGLEPRFS
jgi:hypothetical protein